jgi:ATP-dependent DNA helicase RecG
VFAGYNDTEKLTENNNRLTENTEKLTENDSRLTENAEKLTENDSRLTEKLTENAEKIIEMIKNNPNITINELSDTLTVSRTTIINNINKLKKQGIIERIGPDKGGYWKVSDNTINTGKL